MILIQKTGCTFSIFEGEKIIVYKYDLPVPQTCNHFSNTMQSNNILSNYKSAEI